jgi:drug/metabolite transporter (DMT)-like permease
VTPAAITADRAKLEARTLGAFGLLVVLIATNLVAIRYSNRELAPFWNAGLRFALAAALFAILVLRRRTPRPTRSQVLGGIAYGLFSIAGFFAFLYLGLVRATAGIGQTILALSPLVTMFLAVALGMERLRPWAAIGAIVSVIGIAVAFDAAAAAAVPLESMLSILAATASFAAGAIVARRQARTDPFIQNLLATATGAVVLLALSRRAASRGALRPDSARGSRSSISSFRARSSRSCCCWICCGAGP